MVNYFYDCYCILNKVYSSQTYLKQAINSTFIEEKNRALIIKTCYGVLDKDIELTYYLKQLAPKSPKLVVRTILKISMYAIKYLQKKEYAVTKNAVELMKKLGKGGASGFVNAFLRKFVKSTINLPSKTEELLSIKYSYPQFAVEELIKDFGLKRTEKILSVENLKNCVVFYDVDGKKYLYDKNITFYDTPFENVFLTENFIRNKDYDDGTYTFQALGSVAICDVVESCNKLLDCCAAPGGKSVRLSYKCHEVISWDIHEHRVELIKDYIMRMRRNNICASVNDSKIYNMNYVDAFDSVICDAPCSGLGVTNDNPDIKLNRTKSDIDSLSKEQISILNTVSKYVKKDGYLYYSTCSILNRENIDIINEFLSKNKNYELCQLNSKLPHENINGTNLFLPDISGGLGFYVAKLKRVE